MLYKLDRFDSNHNSDTLVLLQSVLEMRQCVLTTSQLSQTRSASAMQSIDYPLFLVFVDVAHRTKHLGQLVERIVDVVPLAYQTSCERFAPGSIGIYTQVSVHLGTGDQLPMHRILLSYFPLRLGDGWLLNPRSEAAPIKNWGATRITRLRVVVIE